MLYAGILTCGFQFAFVSLQVDNQVQWQKFLEAIASQKTQNMKQLELEVVLLK